MSNDQGPWPTPTGIYLAAQMLNEQAVLDEMKLDHVKWAAWGVVDIDNKSKLDRIQRRNYIKRTRAELKHFNIELRCGGSSTTPWYCVVSAKASPANHVAAGEGAFQKVCAHVLKQLEEPATAEEVHA